MQNAGSIPWSEALLAGLISPAFCFGSADLAGSIRVHIAAVRNAVVFGTGGREPDHGAHGVLSGLRCCRNRRGSSGLLAGGRGYGSLVTVFARRIVVAGLLVPGDILAVADSNNGTLQVGAEYRDFHILKLIHGIFMGMSVGIAGSAADHSVFRNGFPEEVPGSGSGRSMMAQTEHIAFQFQIGLAFRQPTRPEI